MKTQWLVARRAYAGRTGARIAHRYEDSSEWSLCSRARRSDRHTAKDVTDRACVHCERAGKVLRTTQADEGGAE